MPSAETIPLAELLAPAGEPPQGADPRAAAGLNSPYRLAKDARTLARAAERSMENGDADAPPADWRPVARHAVAALKVGKDLELASYLTEAQLRIAGFAGLRDGFKLLAGLVRGFWPSLYPAADEDGVSTTLAPVTGLNGEDAPGTLLAPIYRVPLSDAPVTYADYLEAAATAKILDVEARDKKVADGAKTFDKLRTAINGEPAAKTRLLHDDLAEALGAYADLAQALTEHAAEHAPPTSAVRAALEAVMSAVRDLGKEQLAATTPKAAPPSVTEAAPAGEAAPDAPAKVAADGPPGERMPVLRGRDDALAAVQQLADYFRRSEPHSLVPYALEQALRWGRMPLPDLLRELIPDKDALGALFKRAGVPDAG